MPAAAGVDAPRLSSSAASLALAFVPGDPPRTGAFYLYDRTANPRAADGAGASQAPLELDERLEVVLPTVRGAGVRRRVVPAQRVDLTDALDSVAGMSGSVLGADTWSAALRAALCLLATGRLYPSMSASGYGVWRAGPLDGADRQLLQMLARRLPPEGFATPLPGGGPLSLPSPERLVAALFDAVADLLVRTAAARHAVPPRAAPLASAETLAAADLEPWLREASSGLHDGGGADVALRVELDEGLLASSTEGDGSSARAVLQLASRVDPSLVIDAAALYAAPAAVLARFGNDAETDLLRALRRGARAWPPLQALLAQRSPTALALDDDLLGELFGDGAVALQASGIEVRWPAGMVTDGLALRASVAPAPGVVVDSGFGLASLCEFRWQVTLDGELLDEEEIDQLAEAKRGFVRLRGRFVTADPDLLQRLRARTARRLSAAEALAVALGGTVDVAGEPVAVVAEGPVAALAERLSAADPSALVTVGRPEGLAADVNLRHYQQEGVAWLLAMTSVGLGACLADEMGLGKTLQVISLHLHRASARSGPTLVVCPTSLVANWEREIRRFAPEVPVRRFHGPARDLSAVAPDEIVITSYGVARQDAAVLADAGFGLAVADEAQHAKNPESATARALRQITSTCRVALTGTPVENRLSELWAILDWTTPGLLGPLERFTREVAKPIEADSDPVVTARLARVVQPFVLRRRKSDPRVAPDLPARTVRDVPVPLTSEQTTLYEAEVREALAVIEREDGIARQALVLRLLTVLKQICNHPAQYLHERGPLAGRSGKLAALEELVDVIVTGGESVLVFSQFVECLRLLETRLADLGVTCALFHGGLGARRRTELVDAFQAGAVPVLLLSLKAGGVGLNLTRATHVIHYDRWWNPAVEDQATDRAHRIGQDRPVEVHRLVAEGTLEDRIAQVIERKRSLAEAVVGGGESWIGRLSDAELAELVRLGAR